FRFATAVGVEDVCVQLAFYRGRTFTRQLLEVVESQYADIL
ncbi:hypothetical protein PSYJA_36509, partial [Pseudomonas syringae pv. japonica str. M301072]